MDYRPGADIFESGAECIVNPVNCQVHKLRSGWQKGLAGAFESRFPAAQPPFRAACEKGAMKPGFVQLIRLDRATGARDPEGDLFIAHLATKDHWAVPSRMEWVDRGLEKLAAKLVEKDVKSVALPMLGAGLGKLAWHDVRGLVEKHFRPLADAGVKVMVMGEGPEHDRGRAGSSQAAGARRDVPEDMEGIYVAGIGARKTPEAALERLEKLSRRLARRGYILRSGGADGADTVCEKAWDAEGARKQIFLGWNGMNGRKPDGKSVFCFDMPPGCIEEEVARKVFHRDAEYPEGNQKAWRNQRRGSRALQCRNTNQVLGPNVGTSPKTSLVICWTKNGDEVGGTAQALRIANDNDIAILNLGDPRYRGWSTDKLEAYAVARIDGQSHKAAFAVARASERAR